MIGKNFKQPVIGLGTTMQATQQSEINAADVETYKQQQFSKKATFVPRSGPPPRGGPPTGGARPGMPAGAPPRGGRNSTVVVGKSN